MDGNFFGVRIVSLVTCILSIGGTILTSHFLPWSSDNRYFTDSCDCRHQCEWQLDLMNKTFSTLLAIHEDKITKLHHSDMNMALIREQLHKEMLELFLYEYQTINHRLKDIKTDSVPQFCFNWNTNMDSSKYKESIVKLQIDNQRLLERERQLKLRLRRQPDLPQIRTRTGQHTRAIAGSIVALLC